MVTKENKVKDSKNIVLVGAKPFMNYVSSVIMLFSKDDVSRLCVLARGKFISKAVDVVEVTRRKFLDGKKLSVGDVKIGSEEFENKEGKKINVSTIEIDLLKEIIE